jgi:hypothetical protein
MGRKSQKSREGKGYTFPELMAKYFPDDPTDTDAVVESIITREDFFDILMRVSRPQQVIPPDKGNSETSR